MVVVHVFGENVLDLESKIVATKLSGFTLSPAYLNLPFNTALRTIDEKSEVNYYGVIDPEDRRIVKLDSQGFRIPVDAKYSVKDSFVPLKDSDAEGWQEQKNISDFIDLLIDTKTGGGGAHNCATGIQVYLNDIIEQGGELRISDEEKIEKVKLWVPYGSEFIKGRLPENLEYCPILGTNEAKMGISVNVALEWGKKFTFRSSPKPIKSELGGMELGFDIKEGDVIIVDSLKDKDYLKAVEKYIDAIPNIRFYFAPTDSMVTALGRERVYNLALKADLVISNDYEFQVLMDKRYPKEELIDNQPFPSEVEFTKVLGEFQKAQSDYNGKKALVVVTHGDRGATAIDPDGRVLRQAVAVRYDQPIYGAEKDEIVNTSGCGDASNSLGVLGKLLGHAPQIILSNMNAAGHICAFRKEASGPWMATQKLIENFRKEFGAPDVRYWNQQFQEFRKM